MGCGNCGTGAKGKPSGCQSNGGCSTGGCNRMNVFDWLADLPLHDGAKPYPIIEVTFNQGSRKEFFRNGIPHLLPEKGQWIAVEGTGGYDVGQVSLTGELVKLQMKKYSTTEAATTRKVLRVASDEEVNLYYEQKEKEPEILIRSRAMARSLKLDMKIAEVEMQGDGRKGTFYYTADQRVDFRELIKLYATDFRMKVEMKQIGARQESAKVGGIGSCGRELCCSTWLTDFKSVNTAAARYQNLSINQTKLSGQCGRLKCCLNYELDTYMDALRSFPSDCDKIETAVGVAYLQKRDIFRMLMWYNYHGSNKPYPITIERAKEIAAANKQGIKPEELGEVEIESPESKKSLKVDMGFVNDVGQISLRALERNSRKRRHKGDEKKGGEKRPGQQGGQPQKMDGDKSATPQQQRGPRPERGPRPDRPQGEKGGQKPQGQGQQPKPQAQQGGNRPGGNPNPKPNPRPQQKQQSESKPEGGQQQQNRPPRPPRNRGPRPGPQGPAGGGDGTAS